MNQSYAPPQQATSTPAQTSAPQTATPDQDTHGNSYMAQGLGGGGLSDHSEAVSTEITSRGVSTDRRRARPRLFDEYPTTGESAGDPLNAGYQQLIADNVELPPGGMPTKGNTDSIMSNGMQVETWHYAPFVAALKAVTGSQDWIV